MSVAVELPALGESVVEGTVSRWLVAEGERVERDQPIVEVTTDKVDAEIPAPVAGVVEKILAREGEVVAVGQRLALIAEGSEARPRASTAAEPAAAAAAPARPAEPARDAAPAARRRTRGRRSRRGVARRGLGPRHQGRRRARGRARGDCAYRAGDYRACRAGRTRRAPAALRARGRGVRRAPLVPRVP